MPKTTSRLVVLAIAAFALGACSSLIPVGSGGGTARTIYPADSPPSSFVWDYDNWIEFQRNLVVSVDSVFARYDQNDRDVVRAVEDFARPAERVFQEELDIFLWGKVKARSSSKSFTFSQESSDWNRGYRLTPDHPMAGMLASRVANGDYRWRADILNADIMFNSLAPKRVIIRAKLSIEMQRLQGKRWVNVAFDKRAVERKRRQVRKALNWAYYRYLASNYGFEVTSSKFGGLNEQ